MSVTELRNKVKSAVLKEGLNIVRTSSQHTSSEVIITLRIENNSDRLSLKETALIATVLNKLGVSYELVSLHNRTDKYPPRVRYKFFLNRTC
jgi:hypothetical protein